MYSVLIQGLSLCPRSWKILLLNQEYNINYEFQQLDISTRLNFPIIDNYSSDLSYIFSNFSKFIKSQEDAKFYGVWNSLIDCTLIPEIIMPIRYERVINPVVFRKHPDMENLRIKRLHLKKKLQEISQYLTNHPWLGAQSFSLCDITLSTSIAVLDYLGEIQWKDESIEGLYVWYLKIKSRKSFQAILEQKCNGMPAYSLFRQLDF